jgi:hypothetical protein
MKTKDILHKCISKLSRESVGVDNLYKFFMPATIKMTISGGVGLDVTDEEAQAVSDLYKEKFVDI